MNNKVVQVILLKIFRIAFCGAILFCSTSCLVSNHLFIPLETKKHNDEIIQGENYSFECYAMFTFDDILEINVNTNFPKAARIIDVRPYWIVKNDSIYARLEYNYKGTYRFKAPKIKKRKQLHILVKYENEGEAIQLIKDHNLRKIRHYFFAIH